MPNTRLIIFGKYPRKGFVKTRLARSIGDDRALSFFRACIGHIFDEADLARTIFEPVFFYAEEEDIHEVHAWLGDRFRLFAQPKRSLVERNIDAFQRMFEEGAEKVVIVATDIPDLSCEIFKEATEALNTHDIIIGRDNADGYYLLGMNRMHKKLFTVEYGAQPLGVQLIARAKELSLSLAQLPVLFNVNTLEDLRAWQTQVKDTMLPIFDTPEQLI